MARDILLTDEGSKHTARISGKMAMRLEALADATGTTTKEVLGAALRLHLERVERGEQPRPARSKAGITVNEAALRDLLADEERMTEYLTEVARTAAGYDRNTCDFCETRGSVKWAYPAGDMKIVLPGALFDRSDDAWAACERCSELLEAGDLVAMARHVLRVQLANEGVTNWMPRGMWERGLANMTLHLEAFQKARLGPRMPDDEYMRRVEAGEIDKRGVPK